MLPKLYSLKTDQKMINGEPNYNQIFIAHMDNSLDRSLSMQNTLIEQSIWLTANLALHKTNFDANLRVSTNNLLGEFLESICVLGKYIWLWLYI